MEQGGRYEDCEGESGQDLKKMKTLAVWPSAGSTSGGKNGKCKDGRLALVQPLRTDRVSECRSGEVRQRGGWIGPITEGFL